MSNKHITEENYMNRQKIFKKILFHLKSCVLFLPCAKQYRLLEMLYISTYSLLSGQDKISEDVFV